MRAYGNVVVVGAYNPGQFYSGESTTSQSDIYSFHGTEWNLVRRIEGTEAGDGTGWNTVISRSGETVAISSPGIVSATGSVSAYKFKGLGSVEDSSSDN